MMRAEMDSLFEKTFVCPQCGGHFYGSHTFGYREKLNWKGYCKGCTFTWWRAREEQYFFYLVPVAEAQ